MSDRLLDTPLRNCSSSPSVATSLAPVCAGDASHAVGLVMTVFTRSTATPPVGSPRGHGLLFDSGTPR